MTKTQLTNLSSLVELVVVTLFLLSRLPYNRTHLNTSLLSHTMDRVSFAQTLTRFLSNTAIIKGTTNPHPFFFSLSLSLSHTHTPIHHYTHTHQCDQTAWLFFQCLAIYCKDNLPNRKHNFLAKVGFKFCQIITKPSIIAKDFFNLAKVMKFHPFWSHWQTPTFTFNPVPTLSSVFHICTFSLSLLPTLPFCLSLPLTFFSLFNSFSLSLYLFYFPFPCTN